MFWTNIPIKWQSSKIGSLDKNLFSIDPKTLNFFLRPRVAQIFCLHLEKLMNFSQIENGIEVPQKLRIPERHTFSMDVK